MDQMEYIDHFSEDVDGTDAVAVGDYVMVFFTDVDECDGLSSATMSSWEIVHFDIQKEQAIIAPEWELDE